MKFDLSQEHLVEHAYAVIDEARSRLCAGLRPVAEIRNMWLSLWLSQLIYRWVLYPPTPQAMKKIDAYARSMLWNALKRSRQGSHHLIFSSTRGMGMSAPSDEVMTVLLANINVWLNSDHADSPIHESRKPSRLVHSACLAAVQRYEPGCFQCESGHYRHGRPPHPIRIPDRWRKRLGDRCGSVWFRRC